MSVNMPNLCQQLDSVLATDRLHSALLISTTGAVVVSACLLPQRDRTIISLAALGTETWTEIASSPERDGWATCDLGNLFVTPVVAAQDPVEKASFLIIVCGPEDAGWDLLEQKGHELTEMLAPLFVDCSETDTPSVASS